MTSVKLFILERGKFRQTPSTVSRRRTHSSTGIARTLRQPRIQVAVSGSCCLAHKHHSKHFSIIRSLSPCREAGGATTAKKTAKQKHPEVASREFSRTLPKMREIVYLCGTSFGLERPEDVVELIWPKKR